MADWSMSRQPIAILIIFATTWITGKLTFWKLPASGRGDPLSPWWWIIMLWLRPHRVTHFYRAWSHNRVTLLIPAFVISAASHRIFSAPQIESKLTSRVETSRSSCACAPAHPRSAYPADGRSITLAGCRANAARKREREGGEPTPSGLVHRKEFLQIIHIIASWTFQSLPRCGLRFKSLSALKNVLRRFRKASVIIAGEKLALRLSAATSDGWDKSLPPGSATQPGGGSVDSLWQEEPDYQSII